jgi:nucleotide-binding universal stress UspA family protein
VSVRRILVALDGSPESRTTLAAAARLGTTTGAELHGLFVEDVDLLRLAGLPFAREAGVSSGEFRALETADIERRFRVSAEKARASLHEAAQAAALRSSFRVARGRVLPELLAAAAAADVVATGKRRGLGPAGRRLGTTARGLIAQVLSPVLVGGAGSSFAGPTVVVCETPEVPREALGFATLLSRAYGAEGNSVRVRALLSISPEDVKALPEIAIAGIVVLVRPEGPAGHELLVALAESAKCPVFVIGPHGPAELLSA